MKGNLRNEWNDKQINDTRMDKKIINKEMNTLNKWGENTEE